MTDTPYTSRVAVKYLSSKQERNNFLTYEKAIQKDFEGLLDEFTALESFKYNSFAPLWVKHKLSLLFLGCTQVNELAYLTEICINCAKKYIMFTKSHYLQIGGFYLLYGLYYKQPIKHLNKIRLTLTDFRAIKQLILNLTEMRQNDIVYIYNKLKQDDAFLYTYTQYDLAPDIALQRHELQNNIIENKGKVVVTAFMDANDDFLKKMNSTIDEYDELFRMYTESNKLLMKIPLTIAEDISTFTCKFQKQLENSELNVVEPKETILSTRKNIKHKAFKKKNKGFRDPLKLEEDDL